MNAQCDFMNRDEAAEMLASYLFGYRERDPLILAIPRGAVPMGKIIAARLGGQLDIVLVRKLGAPFNPEFAIGAVDETGWVYLAPFADRFADRRYLEQEQALQMQALAKRRAQYTPFRRPVDAQGRVAIIVDDGLATGATMAAALHAMRAKRPAELVCAVPVAAPDSLENIRRLADKVHCLCAPANFTCVGQFYRAFPPVTDDDVTALLSQGSWPEFVRHQPA